jgi:hypothetical protein
MSYLKIAKNLILHIAPNMLKYITIMYASK